MKNTSGLCSGNNSYYIINTPVASYEVTFTAVFLLPIFAILGCIANGITFIVLKKYIKESASRFYFQCLAVFDSLALISMLPTLWVALMLKPYYKYLYGQWPYWIDSFVRCSWSPTRLFVSFFLRSLAIWTLVLLTIERLISVVWPKKAELICTLKAAKLSVVLLVFCLLLGNIPWFMAFEEDKNKCLPEGFPLQCRGSDVLFVNRIIEFVFLSLIPALIICVSNSLICSAYKKHDIEQRQTTAQLLAVSICFVVCMLPSMVIISIHTRNELNDWTNHKEGILADLFHIAMLLFSFYLSINLLLYSLTSNGFREAFGKFLRGESQDREDMSLPIADE